MSIGNTDKPRPACQPFFVLFSRCCAFFGSRWTLWTMMDIDGQSDRVRRSLPFQKAETLTAYLRYQGTERRIVFQHFIWSQRQAFHALPDRVADPAELLQPLSIPQ